MLQPSQGLPEEAVEFLPPTVVVEAFSLPLRADAQSIWFPVGPARGDYRPKGFIGLSLESFRQEVEVEHDALVLPYAVGGRYLPGSPMRERGAISRPLHQRRDRLDSAAGAQAEIVPRS